MDGSVTKAEGRNPNEPGDQPAYPGLRCHFRCGRHAHRVLALGRTHLMEMDVRGAQSAGLQARRIRRGRKPRSIRELGSLGELDKL